MSRSGYNDGCADNWGMICWRGAVASAIRGARGQRLLAELAQALDEMPVKELIADELVESGAVCALGAVGVKRGIELANVDPENDRQVAQLFDIAPALAREIVWINDEGNWRPETPAQRWTRVRAWVADHVKGNDALEAAA